VKALKTGTKALVLLTILIGALATSAVALPTLAAPLRDRDQLQDQDQLMDQDKLQTCNASLMERDRIQDRSRLQACAGNSDENCTRTCNCSNQGSGTQESFQWRLGAPLRAKGKP